MKKALILFFLAGWLSTFAQEQKSSLHWYKDFDQAQAVAKKEHKPILLLFTGSDWCPPCMAMHRELFVDKDFIALAKKVVLVYVDFPKRKQLPRAQIKKNYAMKSRFYPRGGVPSWVAVDASGKIFDKKVGYYFGRPESQLKFFEKVIKH